MRGLQRTILCLGVGLAAEAAAHEPKQGDIWATVGPFGYRTRSAERADPDAPLAGMGLVAEGDVDFNGGVEIAMFYLDKTYYRRQDDDHLAERIKRMYITTGYRHWFSPWVSAAVAMASSYSMGDVEFIRDERPSGLERETSAQDVTEYGVDLSLQTEIVRWGEVGVVVDARYQRSLTRKSHEDADVLGLLLGFKYLVPKRGP